MNITEIIGFSGLFLLIFAYVIYNVLGEKPFVATNIVASSLLTLYAFLIGDVVFTIVNGFIVGLLVARAFKLWRQ